MRDEIVVVPIDAPDRTVKSAEHNSKRATMVGAISLDGAELRPCIALSSKRSEKELIANGYGKQNVLIIYQKKKKKVLLIQGVFHAELTKFILELNARRQKYGYQWFDTNVFLSS